MQATKFSHTDFFFPSKFIIPFHILITHDVLKHNQNSDGTGNIVFKEQTLYLCNSATGKTCKCELYE